MLPGLCMCACSGLFMCTCEVMVVHTFMSTASSHRQFMLLVECESVCDGFQVCLEVGVFAYPMRNAFGEEDSRRCGMTCVW